MDRDWKSLESKPAIKVGDLVRNLSSEGGIGLVLRIDVNMWGEEMTPSGIEVLWGEENEVSVEYGDEVELA